jgi:hypothetical protein
MAWSCQIKVMGSWLGQVKSKSWVHGLVRSNQSHGFMAWSGQIKVMGSWLGHVKSKTLQLVFAASLLLFSFNE